MSQAFTISQIAGAIGKTRQAVSRMLRGITPSSHVIVSGGQAAAYVPIVLPAQIQELLSSEANRRGYRDVEALLSAPPEMWEAKIPLAELHQDCIDEAVKLQRALAGSLERMSAGAVSAADVESAGLQDYRAAFGHSITGRYWRKLVSRTEKRDGGAGNWARLEIYLPDQLKRKAFAGRAAQFQELNEVIAGFQEPSNPNSDEKALLWLRSLEMFSAMKDDGRPAKRLRLDLIQFLWDNAPWLAKSANALRVAFDTRLARWTEAAGAAESQTDGRTKRRGISTAEPFSADSLDKITWRANQGCGGRVSQAVRELIEEDALDPQVSRYFLNRRCNKSSIPTRLREAVRNDVAALAPLHQGPRAAEKLIPSLDLSYDGISSMDILQADDFTMPVYFRVPDGAWWRLTRGQVLMAIDWRSLCVLGFCLYPEGQYNSGLIRTLFTRVFDKWGLPDCLYLERGIWKRSKLITGGPRAEAQDPEMPFSEGEIEMGLRQYGVQFMHARRARSKPVERVGGLVQDRMEGLLGYCGREEKKDRPEALTKWMRELERGNDEALGHFLIMPQWEERLAQIFESYNAAMQDGKRLCGSSPEAVFNALWDPGSRTRFDDSCRFLLAHHKVPVIVKTGEGKHGLVQFQVRGETFRYANEQTGRLAGQKLVAFFNPEAPDRCTFTDMKYRNPFTVERLGKTNGGRIDGNYAEEVAKVHSAVSYAKARYRMLKAKFEPSFRQNVVSRSVVELGQHIEEDTTRAAKETRHRETRVRKIRATARDLAVPSELLTDDEETRSGLEMMLAARREHEAAETEGQ